MDPALAASAVLPRRRKWKTAAAFLVACLSAAGAGVIGAAYWLGRARLPEGASLVSVRSRALGEQRELIVHLPESYARDAQRRYPVLYVLDGSSEDIHTARSARLMARIGVMPELIVVGIPNVSGSGRQRDYTPPFMAQDTEDARGQGQADRFLAFIKTEAVPFVEANYRTASSRMLAGHSRGGLFVVYSLIADPNLFDARFAHSPALWRDESALVARLGEFLSAHPDLETSLYLSLGSEEVPKMAAAFEAARAGLRNSAGPRVHWKAEVVAGADHQRNGEMATPLGFRALYCGWKPGAAEKPRLAPGACAE